MKNELAIVFCVHSNPWLIMTTLISTLVQDYKNYDIYFIYQEGDGTDVMPQAYKEYYDLVKRHDVNVQLSDYDP